MRTSSRRLAILGMPVEVVRKDIKNLHVAVYPPVGRVRVATPLRLDDDAVRVAVISRLGWIRRQQARFADQVRESQRELATGESIYFRGRRFRLEIIEDPASPGVRVATNSRIQLQCRPGADRAQREATLNDWYRERLREQIPPLLRKWERKVGVNVAEVRIRRMKTRWGSCNAAARRIWLNLELAKKPASSLEYILVHEMIHIHERRHGERFREMMDVMMPGWHLHRDELNRAPLVHEDWRY
ncbi:MAG: M48 family metallopeptidase [Gemmatimonadota bacterium]|nr:M48 family metallopeptidase [Gemmatimonadota bacterium]